MADRPVRVAHVIARLNVGGPAALVTTLARRLDGDVVALVVHGRVGEGEEDWRALHAGPPRTLEVPGLGRAVRPGDDVAALARLVTVLRRVRPDVVHTHTAKAGALGRLAARAAGVPHVVHTFHGHVLHGYFGATTRRGIVATERRLARLSDRIVTVGAAVRDDLLAAGIGRPEQFVVIGPGVDPPSLPAPDLARQRLGVPLSVPVVTLLGRLTAIKRPDRAVEALRRVRDGGHEVHLLVAGDGDLADSTRKHARRELGEAVTFTGWTADVGGVLAASDVLVLTSDNEGMPVTLAEAAHAGVPVVATAVGGVGEVVVDGVTGLLVAPSAAAVADGLLRLLDDPPLRERLGRQAIGHAGQHLSTATLVDAHRQLYHEVTAL